MGGIVHYHQDLLMPSIRHQKGDNQIHGDPFKRDLNDGQENQLLWKCGIGAEIWHARQEEQYTDTSLVIPVQ